MYEKEIFVNCNYSCFSNPINPVRMNLKDGGSVRYKSISGVVKLQKYTNFSPEVDGVKPYIDGFEIKILGMTVYRETNE